MVWTFRSNWMNLVLLATYLKYIDCNSLSSLKTTVIHSCSSWSVKQCTTPSSVTTTIICRQIPHLSAIVLEYVITYVSLKQQKVKFELRIKLTASKTDLLGSFYSFKLVEGLYSHCSFWRLIHIQVWGLSTCICYRSNYIQVKIF